MGEGAANGNDLDIKALLVARALDQAGPSCTATQEAFTELVQGTTQHVDEAVAAHVLGLLARSTQDGVPEASSLAAALAQWSLGSASGKESSWNAENIVQGLQQLAPGLDWIQVLARLDYVGFVVTGPHGLTALVAAVKIALGPQELFPWQPILDHLWSNTTGQLSLLCAAVSIPPDVLSFQHHGRQVGPFTGPLATVSTPPAGSPWLCLDFVELLCKLSAAHPAAVRALLDDAVKQYPEVLTIALASIPLQASRVQQDLLEQLLAQLLPVQALRQHVLGEIWSVQSQTVLQAAARVCDRDPAAVQQLADALQELGVLLDAVQQTPPPLCLELAAIGGSRGLFGFGQLLRERLQVDGVAMVAVLLQHLIAQLQQQQAAEPGKAVPPLLLADNLTAVVQVVGAYAATLPINLQQELQAVQGMASSLYPQLAAVQPDSPSLVPLPDTASYGQDVENEANAFFQAVYNGENSVQDAVVTLQRYKLSPKMHERVVFDCALHNIFDEYRFFSEYPEKELQITALLFGAFVHHQLVVSISLGIALKYVRDAVRKPVDSPMFSFGVTALRQFLSDLHLWPQYCRELASIPQLQSAAPDVAAAVEQALQGVESSNRVGAAAPVTLTPAPAPPTSVGSADAPAELQDLQQAFESSTPVGEQQGSADEELMGDMPPLNPEITAAFAAPPSAPAPPSPTQTGGARGPPLGTPSGTPGKGNMSAGSTRSAGLPVTMVAPGMLFNTINAETLETAAQQVEVEVPNDAVIDKVHFSINNLAQLNLETKCAEIRKLVTEQYWPWFTNYMVVKRAAQEPNFHNLYIDLIEKMGDKELFKLMIKTTHRYVRVLLTSDRIKKDSGERTLLKNLGSWLGSLTIKRNRVLLHVDLDLKTCLQQAYQQGKLVAVIPFIDKVLEPCGQSQVFKPPNPWLMAIMSLLAEIYALDNLKLNLKFGIELIFNHTGVAISQVKPSNLLAGCTREQGPSNPDFTDAVPPPSPAQPPAPQELAPQQAPLPGPAPPQGPPASAVGPPPPRPPDEPRPAAPPSLPLLTAGTNQAPKALFANLHSFVQVTPANLAAYNKEMERIVPTAVDKAIYDIMTPVVERSVTIACCTTKELIRKDFAPDPNEQRMRSAAQSMVSGLAGSLAIVTCKEPLKLSLMGQLRNLLQGVVPDNQLEAAVNQISNDNLDLGCSIIERAAMEKAAREIDERLMAEVQMRQQVKATGQPYVDPLAGTVPAGIPESLRPRNGALNAFQSRVYEEFGRIPQLPHALQQQGVPGVPVPAVGLVRPVPTPPAGAAGAGNVAAASRTAPAAVTEVQALFPQESPQVAAALWDKLQLWLKQLEVTASKEPHLLFSQMPEGGEMAVLVAALPEIAKLSNDPEKAALGLALKVYQRLQKGLLTRALLTSAVAAMTMLRDKVCPKLPLEVTTWLCNEDDARLNKDIAEALARRNMLHLPQLDTMLAKLISANRAAATDLTAHLVQQLMVMEAILVPQDLYNTLEVLVRFATRIPNGAALIQLVEQAKQAARMRPAKAPARPKPPMEPPQFREQLAALLDEWARLTDENPLDKVQAGFMAQLQQTGLLKGDEQTFFRVMTELTVIHCLNNEAPAAAGRPGTINFAAVDTFVRMTSSLVMYHGGGPQLLHKALSAVINVLVRDADDRAGAFNSRPYFRLLVGLITEMTPLDPNDVTGFAYLMTIAGALLALQPMRVPGFAFSWLELISHRMLMPKLLLPSSHVGWPMFQKMLGALLRFMKPYLHSVELTDAVRLLYKGTLRVLLVLLHDFPEFLCEYYFVLCDIVPPSCIQMRNLILSAFPRIMRLPDPFTPNLKVDLLPEIHQCPKMVPDADALLPAAFKKEVDTYLATRQPSTFPASLKQRLVLRDADAATGQPVRYNVSLISALVCYVGVKATANGAHVVAAGNTLSTPAMDIFQRLLVELDPEGRYQFLNAMANQLRYPNSHTHYFSCVLLCLFKDSKSEVLQEQITRVLLERLIVNRPHPWGLLISFIELIKNPTYNFWTFPFTRCAPEIERLFTSVSRSCMGPQALEGGEELPMQMPGSQPGDAIRG